MVAVDYTADIKGARKSIEDAGITCQLSRDGATFDVPAVITSYKASELGFQNTDGSMILRGDYKALIPGGLERNPDPEQDRFIIPSCDIFPDGKEMRIVFPNPTAPSGQAIIWELQIRGD